MKNLNGKYFVALALLVATGSVVAMEGPEPMDIEREKAAEGLALLEHQPAPQPRLTVQEALYKFIMKDDAQRITILIKEILRRGGSIQTIRYFPDNFFWTPLHIAARENKPNAAKALLTAGANPNAQDRKGETPLHTAAVYGDATVAKMLLDAHSDKNAQNRDGLTPLHQAAQFNNTDVVEALLAVDAIVNTPDRMRWTALHSANTADVTKALLAAGANKNAQTPDGLTPLHIAARSGQVDKVEVLLNDGADIGAKDRDGRTAFDLAEDSSKTALNPTPFLEVMATIQRKKKHKIGN